MIPGVVVDRPGESDRGVTSRVTGIVAEILAKPGDTVMPGATLFRLELVSEVLQTTQIELAKSATDLALATTSAIASRISSSLAPHRPPTSTGSKTRWIASPIFSDHAPATSSLWLRGRAGGRGRGGRGGDGSHDLRARSDSAGTLYEVKDLKVRLGDQVQAGQALCTLADHRRLYVEGWAFKTEAKSLAVAADKQVKIEVEFADESPGDWKPYPALVIHHLANTVDPVNRTFPFYLSLDNQAQSIVRDGKTTSPGGSVPASACGCACRLRNFLPPARPARRLIPSSSRPTQSFARGRRPSSSFRPAMSSSVAAFACSIRIAPKP